MSSKGYSIVCILLVLLYSISNISCGNSSTVGTTGSEDSAIVVKSIEEQAPGYLTFSKAFSLVASDSVVNQQIIDFLFEDCALPKIQAEEYAVEFDPDPSILSMGINYCWGFGVDFKNWEMKPIADDYYGVCFTLCFSDNSAKTGNIRDINIMTNSKIWYDKFMQDANEAKFVYSKEVSSLFGSGKTFIVDIDGFSYFYINDLSEDEKYNIIIGYDNGGDI